MEKYNGWTNRETWATALHINNDERFYRLFPGKTADEIKLRFEHAAGCISRNETVYSSYVEALEDIADISQVNWEEIADALRDSE